MELGGIGIGIGIDKMELTPCLAVTSRRVLGYGYSLVKEPVPKSGTEYLLVSFN